jgi:hypothetical protein
MESKDSLSCSQQTTSDPYPQPDETSPQLTPRSREKLTVTQLVKKLPAFCGTEGSLPCSQEPASGPYHELDASSPHLTSLFP